MFKSKIGFKSLLLSFILYVAFLHIEIYTIGKHVEYLLQIQHIDTVEFLTIMSLIVLCFLVSCDMAQYIKDYNRYKRKSKKKYQYDR